MLRLLLLAAAQQSVAPHRLNDVPSWQPFLPPRATLLPSHSLCCPPVFSLRRCGFEEVPRSEVPLYLQLEYFIGIALAWLVTRDRLVLMRLAQQARQEPQQGQQQAAAAGAAAAVDANPQLPQT